jgi:xanthine dehydrogenase accessory factor
MSDEALFREIAEELERRGRLALATVVETRGSGPSRLSRRFLIFDDGSFSGTIGGGPFEALVVADAGALFRGETGRILKWYDFFEREIAGEDREPTNMICGGSARVSIELLRAAPTLVIYGGGHVGLALARLGRELSYDVIVADDRIEYARPERFPEGVRAIRTDRDYTLPEGTLPPGRERYVAVVTRCWETDLLALRPWLRGAEEPAYLGVIGSKRKVRGVLDCLRQEGIPEGRLARIRGPIGIGIGAVTPAEVAVSIAAEMTAVRRATASSHARHEAARA